MLGSISLAVDAEAGLKYARHAFGLNFKQSPAPLSAEPMFLCWMLYLLVTAGLFLGDGHLRAPVILAISQLPSICCKAHIRRCAHISILSLQNIASTSAVSHMPGSFGSARFLHEREITHFGSRSVILIPREKRR